MKILVIGGTRFFGIHMVEELLEAGHEVTIATRGRAEDPYEDRVKRITLERTDAADIKEKLGGIHFDVVIDKIAYCSNDIKYVMDVIDCDKYIHMSSTAVYAPKQIDTKEEDFDAAKGELIWCGRDAFPYDEVKRQAEYALWQKYPEKNWIAVRYPVVLGEDDYTGRLLFYVEHVMKSIPMHVDNLDKQMGYIRSDEAGKFLAFLADKSVNGAINGSARGTISLKEIIAYVEDKTGAKAILDEKGDEAPYNGEVEFSINTDKANSLGFAFSKLQDWIYELLDFYIALVENKENKN
ncbi:MAG: NAD-dependent epimerase/dehydratase family protein [Lachnospiraceae bacterium]|nr:NAD-dependent epimerase/dehydratase family protein [Lachnospiraceae bacterium]